MDKYNNVPPWMKLLALIVVGSVAKRLFGPPAVYYTQEKRTETPAQQALESDGS